MKKQLAFISLLSLTACTGTPREKTLSLMLSGVAAGAAYGATRPEMKRENAFIFGGSLGVLGAATGFFLFNDDEEVLKVKAERDLLKLEIEKKSKGTLIKELPATFSAKIPKQYLPLVRPGSWRVMEIDQWVEDGENRLIHQDKIMELVPPTLSP
jgi:hypothetical protein